MENNDPCKIESYSAYFWEFEDGIVLKISAHITGNFY
jgi:hypothetical protein